jgi:hemin uptake protein HemP
MIAIAGHKIDSRDLFIGTREIIIGHGGETYRLRLTGQNKLILTK